MEKKKFTSISEVGERGLIGRITSGVSLCQESTKLAIGDDAAIIQEDKTPQLVSVDMLVEGVHFDTSYTPLKHLGYKSIIVNVSDICAMGGIATHALVSLGIPNKYSVEHIEELYRGVKAACKNYSLDLIGGDTTASPTGLIVSVTILGKASGLLPITRSGAKPNDLVVVSGDLGASYLGLQILEREKSVFEKSQSQQPNLDAYSYILERQLKPEARVSVIQDLVQNGIQPTSMIDLSDGLSTDLFHICDKSGVGVKIFENKLPFSKETIAVAEEMGISTVTCALNGGEDYELLFTVSQKDYKKIEKINGISTIGHVLSQANKMELVSSQGEPLDMSPGGWSSFLKRNI